ncbi:hypothetical protein BJ138DRAFT_1118250 [Hygrophoropsis aurantiaca]|uniref:Uncharacterized protein n=1 Tax=Hygrophoropsis aurantiaca TaxID=72124 RepID=A0ACB7ZWS5_9AGAM|nr:hypothetical protein BJ138DRAFT_1118250 [Hygrophoropsis aurantiaca]
MGAESRDDPPIPDETPFCPIDDSVCASLAQHINHSSPSIQFQSPYYPVQQGSIILESRVQDRKGVKSNGVVFATRKKHVGNSHILFRAFATRAIRAGCIEHIFLHSREGRPDQISEFFLVVKVYRELSEGDTAHDPYRRYPLLDTRLCYDEFERLSVVIKLKDVISHAASCPYKMETIASPLRVILSLDWSGNLHD